jgi:predicted transcriptional regulator
MSNKLTLHIQQNTTLERVAIILDFLRNKKTNFEQLGASCNLGLSVLQKVVFPFLRNLSIISKKNPPSLTPLGEVAAIIQESNPELLGDFLHLLIYNLHHKESEKRFSGLMLQLYNNSGCEKKLFYHRPKKSP